MKRVISAIAILTFMILSLEANAQNQKKNILFIAIDDMKPILGAYGDDFAISPNIDKLAEQGVVFENNHCQYAVCGPSRASLLSGQRPDQTKILDLKSKIRAKRPNVTTLPQHFRNSGYITLGVGKIFDPRSVDKKQDELSWDKYILPNQLKYPKGYNKPVMGYYQKPENLKTYNKYKKEAEEKGLKGREAHKYIQKRFKPAYEKADVPDDAYIDGAILNGGIELLKEASKSDKPFFLAVGFKRPHLPFNAPTKYWEMYDENKVPLAKFQQKVDGGYDKAYHNSSELGSYKVPGYTYHVEENGLIDVPEKQQRALIHGYYAATSYIDAQVGKLMAELKNEGLDKNTIVILWGDHGWHLGDHQLWNKHSDFEQATRSPMIIFDPSIGKKIIVKSPTEFVDIYPTLCDLTGIKTPQNLSGTSLKPLVNGNKTRVKKYAVSEITRGKTIGYTLRFDRYRFTTWVGNNPRYAKKLNKKDILAEELYDYKTDPLETINLAKDPKYKDIIKEFRLDFEEYFNNDNQFKGDVEMAKIGENSWRKDAEERIEKHRKGDVEITLTNKKGEPIVAELKIEQVSHAFRFGGIINSALFVGKKKYVYKETFLKAFEHAGYANMYKIKHKQRAKERTPEINKWLKENDISLRGHALAWERDKFLPNSLKPYVESKDSLKLLKGMDKYIRYALKNYNVIEWDVLNEPRDNHDLNDMTNQNTFAHFFNYANKYRKDKNVMLFLNENKVISSPYKTADKNIEIYFNHIKDIKDSGAPIEAIGFQTRFRQRIAPEEIYRRLTLFEDFNLPMLGTEFEIIDNSIQKFSDEERAEFTEEIMTVYFSHPDVLGIYYWTPFSEENKALFDLDGKPYKNGEVWLEKINEWTTNTTIKSNSIGKASFRGFKGKYKVTVTKNGKKETTFINVYNPDNKIKISVKL